MALCRGSNAGYGSVGPLEPRIYQVCEKSRFQRQRSPVSDIRVTMTAFSKTALRGCARGTRTPSILPFPHGSFSVQGSVDHGTRTPLLTTPVEVSIPQFGNACCRLTTPASVTLVLRRYNAPSRLNPLRCSNPASVTLVPSSANSWSSAQSLEMFQAGICDRAVPEP